MDTKSPSQELEQALVITEIRVFPIAQSEHPKLKAFVTVVLNDCFVIRDLKIIQGAETLFLSMPSKKSKDGTFKDIAHPLKQSIRTYFEEKVFDAYRKSVTK